MAGLRLKAVIDGKDTLLTGGTPKFTSVGKNTVHISWPLTSIAGSLEMVLNEKTVTIKLVSKQACNWFLDLNTAADAKVPFTSIHANVIDCKFEGMRYILNAVTGQFTKPQNGSILRLAPQHNTIVLNLDNIK